VHILAATETDLDDLEPAAKHYREAIVIARSIKLDNLTAEALSNFSNLSCARPTSTRRSPTPSVGRPLSQH